MLNRLDYKTGSGKTVGEILFAPILARGEDFQVVDAGARNGMYELPESYAKVADFIGFEPNEDEYRKLVTGTTDAASYGLHSPRWKSEAFHPYALWNCEETRPFYITVGAGACSLMGHVNEAVAGHMYLQYADGRMNKRYYDHAVSTLRTTTVPCRRLDQLIDSDRPVDYLKLDVEGAELALLEGSEALFAANRILFVKTEFVMVPYYEVHPLFGHQQVFLDKHGLRLLGLDLGHSPYTREPSRIPAATDRRQIYAGDAFFVIDPDRVKRTPEDLHRAGIMAIIHGFASFGLSLIRDGGLVGATELDLVEAALARVPLRSRARYFFETFPMWFAVRLAVTRSRLFRRWRRRAA
jgi:FkbM family methyltransferase